MSARAPQRRDVKKVSEKASALGITVGQKGAEAIELLPLRIQTDAQKEAVQQAMDSAGKAAGEMVKGQTCLSSSASILASLLPTARGSPRAVEMSGVGATVRWRLKS